MKLIARKPCRFNGENFYIGDEIPVDVVADPQTQEMLGVLAIANIESENPDAIYTQEDVDQKVQEAKKELESQVSSLTQEKTTLEGQVSSLTQEKTTLEGQVSTLTQEKSTLEGQITEKDTKIKELEGEVKKLQEQVAAAASISADGMTKISATPTTSTKKKTADKAGEA